MQVQGEYPMQTLIQQANVEQEGGNSVGIFEKSHRLLAIVEIMRRNVARFTWAPRVSGEVTIHV